jgi:hypothetical protein
MLNGIPESTGCAVGVAELFIVLPSRARWEGQSHRQRSLTAMGGRASLRGGHAPHACPLRGQSPAFPDFHRATRTSPGRFVTDPAELRSRFAIQSRTAVAGLV